MLFRARVICQPANARAATIGGEGWNEHSAIYGSPNTTGAQAQSWPEVASFVNHFASGWGALFPLQPIPFQ